MNDTSQIAPKKKTLPLGTFDLNEHGTILKHWPTIKHKGGLMAFINSVRGKNFFTDIAPYEELREFDYHAFLNGAGLEKIFKIEAGVKIVFLRVNRTL